MNKNKLLNNLLLIFTLIVTSFSLPLHADEEFKVVVSIKPVHSILAGLMQGVDGLELLITDDSIPQDYQLTDAQHKSIKQSELLVWVGSELEPFLEEPVAELLARGDTKIETILDNPKIKVLPSRDDQEPESSTRDPYFWMDSRNMIILIDELAKLLINTDAKRAHLYRRNRSEVLSKITKLDRELEYGYRGLKAGVGVNYIDTLQYFEQAYALKINDVLTSSPEETIQGSKLLETRVKLKNGYYSCLLVDRGMPPSELPLLVNGIKVNIGAIDSLGAKIEAGPDHYFELMNHNTNVIKSCLEYEEVPKLAKSSVPVDVEKSDKLGGKFMLVDHNGSLVSEKDMLGSYQLIYFGYTFCPDICPTSLVTMTKALEMLGEQADVFSPYFITLDPERDDSKVMKNYVTYFHKDLRGLTGTLSMVERVARHYNVKYEKVFEEGKDPKLYNMDHTASIFLIAPDGEFITKFAHGITSEQMANGLKEYLPALDS